MTLKDGLAGSILWVPDAHACVQTASRDPLSVKGDGVDLAKVAVQCAQAPSLRNAPDPGRRIVTARNYNIAVDLQAPDAGQMANKNVLAESSLDIPYPQRGISRPRYRRVGIGHLQASHSRRMTPQGMLALTVIMLALIREISQSYVPSSHVPDPNITITTSANKGITPRNHRPHTHNMTLEGLLVITLGIENVDLGVVQCDDDVLWREVQAGDDALVLRNVSRNMLATGPPCRLNQVPLLEVRLVRSDGWSLRHLGMRSRRIETPRVGCERRG